MFFSRPVKTTLVRKQNGWTKKKRKARIVQRGYFLVGSSLVDLLTDRLSSWSTENQLNLCHKKIGRQQEGCRPLIWLQLKDWLTFFFFPKPNLTSQAVNGLTRGLASLPGELCSVWSYLVFDLGITRSTSQLVDKSWTSDPSSSAKLNNFWP